MARHRLPARVRSTLAVRRCAGTVACRALVAAAALAALVVCLIGRLAPGPGARSAHASGQEPDYPRLTDSTDRLGPPAWAEERPLFDVREFLAVPPPSENAARLYLDALAEFGPETAWCFAPEDREQLRTLQRTRLDRYMAVFDGLKKDPQKVRLAEVDQVLLTYEPGFRKLSLAQARPRCAFQTGIGPLSVLPHVGDARTVIYVLKLRTARAVGRGGFDNAIGDVARALRLSRDLRPRGFVGCQLVSLVLDAEIGDALIQQILAGQGVAAKHCDQLLAALQQHRTDAADPWDHAIRMEYVCMRESLNMIYRGDNEKIADVLSELETDDDAKNHDIHALIKRIRRLTRAEYADLLDTINEAFRSLLEVDRRDYRALTAAAETFDKGLTANLQWLDPLVLNVTGLATAVTRLATAYVQAEVRSGAIECLVALRRWQLTEPGRPESLESVCRKSGLPDVSLDAFSGQPPRMTFVGDEPVIYSVASDLKDDGAQADWSSGQQPGDFIFRLSRPQWPRLPEL